MSTDLYVAASAQVAMEKRLESIANNIANMNTAGYRAAGVQFSAALSKVGDQSVAYAGPGDVYITRKEGPVTYTLTVNHP